MKWYFQVLGEHTHVRVFMNGAKCGELCFSNEEFTEIRDTFETLARIGNLSPLFHYSGANVRFIPEPTHAFVCPDCGTVSHNPNDLLHGYCARCHTFPEQRAFKRATGFNKQSINMDPPGTGFDPPSIRLSDLNDA